MGDKFTAVPSWDGSPSTFEAYVTAAKGSKETKACERSLVVAWLWSQLTGAAKSVVRYLEPEHYEGDDGLRQFLDVLGLPVAASAGARVLCQAGALAWPSSP